MMTPDEESCFRNLKTVAARVVRTCECMCSDSPQSGPCVFCNLKLMLDACAQATARAAETEAPEPPTEGPVSAMRTRIEAAGSCHLNKLSPPGVIPTTGQYIEALTGALAPELAGLGERVVWLEGVVQGMDRRITALDGEIGLFAARIHGQVTKLAKVGEKVSEDVADVSEAIGRLGTRTTKLEWGINTPEQPARFAPPDVTPVGVLSGAPKPVVRRASAEFTQQEVFEAGEVPPPVEKAEPSSTTADDLTSAELAELKGKR